MIGVVVVGLLLAVVCGWFWRDTPLVESSEWALLEAMRAEEASRRGEDQ